MKKYERIDGKYKVILEGTQEEKKHLDEILQELPFFINFDYRFIRDSILRSKPGLHIRYEKISSQDPKKEGVFFQPFKGSISIRPVKKEVMLSSANSSFIALYYKEICYDIFLGGRV